ncbi:MAG: Hsp20 family protein [Bacilli bacterium]|nr:Hsp20 family protein [Bacilli bacterium]
MFSIKPFRSNNWLRPRDFYDMVDEFFNDPFFAPFNPTFRTDVKETDDAYLIEAELPGINKDEIKIEYTNDRLIISVNKDDRIDEEKENYIRRERRMSSMRRSFYLGDIDDNNISAKLENGVLKIHVPKKENTSHGRVIEIK